jgi:hypothetical protein
VRGFAEEQALGLTPEKDRERDEQDADAQRSDTIQHRKTQHLSRRDAGERDAEVSTSEWTASLNIAELPVNTAAPSFVAATRAFPSSAAQTTFVERST